MILFSALLSIGLGAIKHVLAPPYRNLFYECYMIWSPLVQKVLAVAAIALTVMAWFCLKWVKREKNCKRTDAQIEILYWEGGKHVAHGAARSFSPWAH